MPGIDRRLLQNFEWTLFGLALAVSIIGVVNLISAAPGDSAGLPPTAWRQLIWLGLGANPELRCLKQDLEWTLGDLGGDAEARSFHPHVTLGRADERDGAGAFRGLDELMAEMAFSGEVKVHTLDLMRSQLSKGGANYTVLASARLSAS